MKPKANRDQGQIFLPLMAELLPLGDGTYRLKPVIPDSGMDTWITVAKAASIIGIGKTSAYELLDTGFLVHKRPLKWKILVSLQSVEAYKAAIADPEFWTNSKLQRELRRRVAEAMEALGKGPAMPLQG